MSWVLSLVINWLLIGYLWRDIATGADGCRHSALTVYKCHDLVCPGPSEQPWSSVSRNTASVRLWDAWGGDWEASQGAFSALK